MKVKALIAGLMLAAGAGSAHATIATGSTASGELFLSVWDQTAQQSYSQDLGIDLSQFILNTNAGGFNSNASWTVALNPSVWGQFFNAANAGSTVYNVVAGNGSNAGLNSLAHDYGYLSSFNSANPAPVAQGGISQILVVGSNIASKAVAYNGADPVNDALNAAKIFSSSSPGYYPLAFGSTFNGAVPTSQSNQALFGGISLAVFHGLDPVLGTDPDTGDAMILDRFDILPGTFQLTATELRYTVGSAPVPVPAAVWLFGSALAGLLSFARRGSRV